VADTAPEKGRSHLLIQSYGQWTHIRINREKVMEHAKDSGQAKPVTDISNCRVRRLDNGWLICLMKTNCAFALPFGNLCSHPRASEITVIDA